jgi:molybdopterin-guanine dinucleotide biosynthesis protein A
MPDLNITLAVLGGGAGSRMGGPKSLLTVNDQAILIYLLRRLAWTGPTLLVTSPNREHPPGWEQFDREVVDAVADQGPLCGLVTALDAAATDIVVAVTCDMPLIEQQQLLWLAAQLRDRPRILGAMLSHDERQIEPFPCAMRKAAISLLRERLASSDRSIHSLATLPQFVLISAPSDWPAETWTNLNHPQDLEAFEKAHPSTRVMRS